MADNKSTSSSTKTQNPESTKGFVWSLVLLLLGVMLFYGLDTYSNWQHANEPITGIGIAYNTAVVKSVVTTVVVVDGVGKNTPAFYVGLQRGDVITAVNEKEVLVASDVEDAIKNLPAGSKVTITVRRNDQKINFITEVAVFKRKDFQ